MTMMIIPIAERVDDIPILLGIMQKVGLAEKIDANLNIHGNWQGLSPGTIIEIWLCRMLSEGDHCLSKVEDWVESRLETLSVFYPDDEITRLDFTDDRLGIILDKLSEIGIWSGIETLLNGEILRIYGFAKDKKGNYTIRLDATIGQSHKPEKKGSLFRFGNSKHHPGHLPQFKLMLAVMDTIVNGFAFPLSGIISPGNTADDTLYMPILDQARKSLKGTGIDKLLIVGDKKLGSVDNRAKIVNNGDYYLCPLSKAYVKTPEILSHLEEESKYGNFEILYVEKKQVGEGFSYEVELTATIELENSQGETIKKKVTWTERRLVVRNDVYIERKRKSILKKIAKAQEALSKLLTARQGKKTPKTKQEAEEMIASILEKHEVSEFITVKVNEIIEERTIRAYKGKPERKEKQIHLSLDIQILEEQINTYCENEAWCVYATNAPKEQMSINDAIQLYKGQYQIEYRFDGLKNKITRLIPIHLQKENRICALVQLMLMALKIVCLIEVNVAKALQESNDTLQGVYPGNKGRKTNKPTMKLMLKRFEGITLSIIKNKDGTTLVGMTLLDEVQLKILALMGLDPNLYNQIPRKVNSIFN